MFEWLWKQLVGGGATAKDASKKGGAVKTKVAAKKAKPTAAKAKKTSGSSSLTAIRSGNTRPNSSSAVARKSKNGGTAVATKNSFDTMYDKLKTYKESNGHCSVPSNDDDKALVNFVRRVRTQYKKVKGWEAINGKQKKGNESPFSLTKDQIKKLESIDFEWEAKRGRKLKGSH